MALRLVQRSHRLVEVVDVEAAVVDGIVVEEVVQVGGLVVIVVGGVETAGGSSVIGAAPGGGALWDGTLPAVPTTASAAIGVRADTGFVASGPGRIRADRTTRSTRC